jgi:uncharacterized protein (TIGR03382 family)
MTRIVPALFSFLVLFTLDAAVAHACSDAGTPVRACSGDPDQPAMACESHADCPRGQFCGANGLCGCECEYGETCDGDACRCAERPEPVVPPGCERVIDSCGDVQVRCPPPDAGPAEEGDPCRPDAGAGSTVPLPEECREPKADEGGACSAGGGGATSGMLALLGAWLVRRRPRARR